jgi:hypothetical protein
LQANARDPDADPGIWLVPRKGGVARHLQPRAPGVQLRGATWGRDGSFLFYAIGRPTGATKAGIAMTDREFVYQVSADGRTVRRLLSDAEGADPRPTGTGKTISSVDLAHRWLGARAQLEVSGRLLVAGSGASGEAINLGLLGSQLPTRRFATVETGPDGRFRIRLRMPARAEPTWRFVTAFFSGSRTAWSTTAFSALGP